MSTLNHFFINVPREFAMARLVHADAPLPERQAQLQAQAVGSDGSRALAGMLSAAVFASLLVVADQLIDTWAEGHLLAAWVTLWVVAFAALALAATRLTGLAGRLAGLIVRRLAAAQQRAREEEMWEHARHDPRIMAELAAAQARVQADF
jgi:cobalamin synthase